MNDDKDIINFNNINNPNKSQCILKRTQTHPYTRNAQTQVHTQTTNTNTHTAYTQIQPYIILETTQMHT